MHVKIATGNAYDEGGIGGIGKQEKNAGEVEPFAEGAAARLTCAGAFAGAGAAAAIPATMPDTANEAATPPASSFFFVFCILDLLIGRCSLAYSTLNRKFVSRELSSSLPSASSQNARTFSR